MHNERLKRIARFLGTAGLYEEARDLTKIAQTDPEADEEMEAGEEAIKKELVLSAIKKGLTEDEVKAICKLGLVEVKNLMDMAKDPEGRRYLFPDEINNYLG
jgi:hypothetical protein